MIQVTIAYHDDFVTEESPRRAEVEVNEEYATLDQIDNVLKRAKAALLEATTR